MPTQPDSPLPEPFEPGLLHFPEDQTPQQAWEAMLALVVEGFPAVKDHMIIATAAIWGVWMGMCFMELDPTFAANCIWSGDRMDTTHFNAGKKLIEDRFGIPQFTGSVELTDDDGTAAVNEALELLKNKDERDA